MKIESCKYYRTRGGRKAFVGAKNPFCDDGNHQFVGYVQGDRCYEKWTWEGRVCNSFTIHPDDLIAEWKEPVTVTRWIALWSDGSVDIQDKPLARPLSHCIAVKQITITEGEGMP